MLLLLSLVIFIFGSSAQCFDLIGHNVEERNGNFFYSYCQNGAQNQMNLYFCQPFFEYFKGILNQFPTSDKCEACETVVRELQKEGEVKRAVENFIDSIAARFCDSLESKVKENCRIWFKTHSQEIKEISKKLIEEGTICKYFLDCQTKEYVFGSMSHFEIDVTDTSPQDCEYCVQGITAIREKLMTGLSYKLIWQTLNDLFCLNSPMSTYKKCSNLIDTLTVNIIKVVDRFQNSTRLCVDLNLCNTSPVNKDYHNFLYYFLHRDLSQKSLCDECNNVTSSQFQELANSVTVNHLRIIGYALLCDDKTYSCKSFVDRITVPLVKQIKHFITKESICNGLLKCTSDRTRDLLKNDFYNYLEKLPENTVLKRFCFICDAFNDIFIKLLNDPITYGLVEFMYKITVCEVYKKNVDECEQQMKMTLPTIITYMTDMIKQRLLCQKICPITPPIVQASFSKNAQEKCTFCEQLFKSLKEIIGLTNTHPDWVKRKLDDACVKMPLKDVLWCKTLTSSRKADIVKMLVSNEKPNKICRHLSQCPEPHHTYFERFYPFSS